MSTSSGLPTFGGANISNPILPLAQRTDTKEEATTYSATEIQAAFLDFKQRHLLALASQSNPQSFQSALNEAMKESRLLRQRFGLMQGRGRPRKSTGLEEGASKKTVIAPPQPQETKEESGDSVTAGVKRPRGRPPKPPTSKPVSPSENDASLSGIDPAAAISFEAASSAAAASSLPKSSSTGIGF